MGLLVALSEPPPQLEEASGCVIRGDADTWVLFQYLLATALTEGVGSSVLRI